MRVLAPTLVIWLDASPKELHARVANRGRSFEAGVDQTFLNALRSGYESVLNSSIGVPLYRPCATKPKELIAELQLVAKAIAG